MSKKRQDRYQTRGRTPAAVVPQPGVAQLSPAMDDADEADAVEAPSAVVASTVVATPVVDLPKPVAMPSVAAVAAVPSIQGDIRGVLIQLAGARLLLPNATIAEVLSYSPPEPVADTPTWLLGRMRWRGWQLPLVGFAELAGFGMDAAGLGSKVIVLKALGGDAKNPYIAIVTQGFPRLVTVSQDTLVVDSEIGELATGLRARVLLNDDAAFVPDLEAVEGLIAEALTQAA